jgi:hypothetical protein
MLLYVPIATHGDIARGILFGVDEKDSLDFHDIEKTCANK